MSQSFMRAALAAVILLPAAAWPARDAEAGQPWPRWSTAEEAGFSSVALAEAEQLWQALDDAPLAAFFLVFKGRVLASFGDESADYECHSVRKSFLSALYGIQVAKGRIDLDATLEELDIDDNPSLTQAEKQATVRDLLMARSGVYHEAACETPEAAALRPERGSHPPGTFWYYNNWDFNALGTIFRQEAGRDIFGEFRKRIARPIGMEDFAPARCYYDFETEHSIHPCYKFRMSARDRARFGQLFLQRGRWGNKQLVPEPWVDESTQSYSDTEWFRGVPGFGYGYMWWVESSSVFRLIFSDPRLHHLSGFSADGYGGQLILVLPDPEMVVVFAVDVLSGGDLAIEESVPILERILTAREIVDLELRKAAAKERAAKGGDTLHLTAKAKNRSTAASLATTVEFYLSPADQLGETIHPLASALLPALAARKSNTIQLAAPVPSGLAPGSYHLVAAVDPDKTNYDLRRTNNLRIAQQPIEIR